jgi:hypothetical protein
MRVVSRLYGKITPFRQARVRQMIAAPIETHVSKVGQALAIGFIVFLVVLSVWELFAIRF